MRTTTEWVEFLTHEPRQQIVQVNWKKNDITLAQLCSLLISESTKQEFGMIHCDVQVIEEVELDRDDQVMIEYISMNSEESITIGHLIYKLGGIDKCVIKQFEKEAVEVSKFKSVWFLKELKLKEEGNITMNMTL